MLLALPWTLAGAAAAESPRPRFEPTPMDVVWKMLEVAEVKPTDVVYDLGCGDGRIVVEAARRYGARGVCVEINPKLLAEARANARGAGVEDRIQFRNEDLLQVSLREATVVTLFLSAQMNLELRPRLQRDLRRGARVVSHFHSMGDWKWDKVVVVRSYFLNRDIFLWTIK